MTTPTEPSFGALNAWIDCCENLLCFEDTRRRPFGWGKSGNLNPDTLKTYHLIVGFDTEYRREVVDGTMPERGNRVVSYQVAIINPATGAQVARWFSLEGTRKVQRRSLRLRLNRHRSGTTLS